MLKLITYSYINNTLTKASRGAAKRCAAALARATPPEDFRGNHMSKLDLFSLFFFVVIVALFFVVSLPSRAITCLTLLV